MRDKRGNKERKRVGIAHKHYENIDARMGITPT